MTFSYNDSELSSDLNRVRRLIGDVSSTSAEFSDEEVEFFIDEGNNIYGAVALAAHSLAAKYADKVTKSVGELSISLSDKYEHFKSLAIKFEGLADLKGSPQIYAGGISKSDKDNREADSDRTEPDFYRGEFDFEGISSTNG